MRNKSLQPIISYIFQNLAKLYLKYFPWFKKIFPYDRILLIISQFWSYCYRRATFRHDFWREMWPELSFSYQENPENLAQSPRPDHLRFESENFGPIYSFCGYYANHWIEWFPFPYECLIFNIYIYQGKLGKSYTLFFHILVVWRYYLNINKLV